MTTTNQGCKQAQLLRDLHTQEQAHVAGLGRELQIHVEAIQALASSNHHAALRDHINEARGIARELQGGIR
jgi:hypothetical protein